MSFSPEFSDFCAQLREFIQSSVAGPRNRAPENARPESRDDISCERDFNRLALRLFGLQFEHNSAYRRLCQARSVVPERIQDWRQIPAMPAAGFKEFETTCLPSQGRTSVFYSSGTTQGAGNSSRHFHCAESLTIYEDSLWPWFAKMVLQEMQTASGFSLGILIPSAAEAPHSSLVHMCDTICRKLSNTTSKFLSRVDASGSWNLDTDLAIRFLERTVDTAQPALLLGTAFSFVHLLDALESRQINFNLPQGSSVMETGGYKGKSRELSRQALHRWIAGRLGLPASRIISEYGMSELSSQAYDTPSASSEIATGDVKPPLAEAKRPFVFPPWCRARIISPETGNEVCEAETGLIRILDLANVCSVAAIQTADLGIRRGDWFELIGRATHAEARGCSLMSSDLSDQASKVAA